MITRGTPPMKHMNCTLKWWLVYSYSTMIKVSCKKSDCTVDHFRVPRLPGVTPMKQMIFTLKWWPTHDCTAVSYCLKSFTFYSLISNFAGTQLDGSRLSGVSPHDRNEFHTSTMTTVQLYQRKNISLYEHWFAGTQLCGSRLSRVVTPLYCLQKL